jgi:hypothetical protein
MMQNPISLIFGFLAIGVAVIYTLWGKCLTPFGVAVSRVEKPAVFWLITGAFYVAGASTIAAYFFHRN